MRGADDDGVAGHEWRGVQPCFSGHEVDVLVEVLFEIDDAVLAETSQAIPGARVEPYQPVPRRDVENLSASAVVAVRQAATREPSRRSGPAFAFIETMHPQQLARTCGHGDHRATRPGGRVQDAVDHQRRRLKVVFGVRPEVRRLDPPGHLEVVEVIGRDLVERRIAGVRDVSAVARPLPVLGSLGHDASRGAGKPHPRD